MIETHTHETTITQETITPARKALLAFTKAWTYPILGNEDVPVTKRLFEEARALSKGVAASAADPPVASASSVTAETRMTERPIFTTPTSRTGDSVSRRSARRDDGRPKDRR